MVGQLLFSMGKDYNSITGVLILRSVQVGEFKNWLTPIFFNLESWCSLDFVQHALSLDLSSSELCFPFTQAQNSWGQTWKEQNRRSNLQLQLRHLHFFLHPRELFPLSAWPDNIAVCFRLSTFLIDNQHRSTTLWFYTNIFTRQTQPSLVFIILMHLVLSVFRFTATRAFQLAVVVLLVYSVLLLTGSLRSKPWIGGPHHLKIYLEVVR